MSKRFVLCLKNENNKEKIEKLLKKVVDSCKGNIHFLSGHEKGSDQEIFEFAMNHGHDFTSYCPQWEGKEKEELFKDTLLIKDAQTIIYFWDSNTIDNRALKCAKIANKNNKNFIIIESNTHKIVNLNFVAEQTLK